MDTLLLVEDDAGLQSQLRWCFENYDVVTAEDRVSAVASVRRFHPSVVTLDLGLPPDPANASEGFAALREILEIAPHTKVIVVTGNDDRANAVKAIAEGAYDFYEKPVDPEVLRTIVDRARHVSELEEENRRLAKLAGASPLEGMLGNSPQIVSICRVVERVAPSDISTLILGESGTGKELVARALHSLSPRSDAPFVAINCAAIPDTLLESELFGYEKGAFTGAVRQTPGKIESANGGTLFLDEIGDMPLALQAKILRFVQERVVERLGGRKEIPVDVRVVCATHQDLSAMMARGEFRGDLYYRISEITIDLPPLRDRPGDKTLLARAFLLRHAKKLGRNIRGFSKDAIDAIESHSWPGNVRELESKVKRAVLMAEGNLVTVVDMGLDLENDEMPLNLKQEVEKVERETVRVALSHCNNNISRTAEMLGTSRPTLYDLIKRYKLK